MTFQGLENGLTKFHGFPRPGDTLLNVPQVNQGLVVEMFAKFCVFGRSIFTMDDLSISNLIFFMQCLFFACSFMIVDSFIVITSKVDYLKRSVSKMTSFFGIRTRKTGTLRFAKLLRGFNNQSVNQEQRIGPDRRPQHQTV